MQQPVPMSLQMAQKTLSEFNCRVGKTVQSVAEKQQVRQALLLVVQHSDYQMLGVLADSLEQGLLALSTYLEALGYPAVPPLQAIAGPVYLKFNAKSGGCYLDSYSGEYRGVLVSCQSAYEGGINEMYGHLPLDLFLDS